MVAAAPSALAAVNAAFADDVGYSVLQADIGSSLPDGGDLAVSLVEACIDTPTPCEAWAPDPALVGRSITDGETVTQVSQPFSGHAKSVSKTFFGDPSTTPGIGLPTTTSVSAYHVDDWLQSDYLNFADRRNLPIATNRRIANHSWVGDQPDDNVDLDLLRRLDWLIATDEFVQVVGFTGNSNSLFGSAFNAIAVNSTKAPTDKGSKIVSSNLAYSVERIRPDLVAPENYASSATPRVASAIALLMQLAHGNSSLSNGSTTNRNGDLIRNGERSEVIKSVLMAGAERATANKYPTDAAVDIVDYRTDPADQTANGLDRRYGAGQLNIYNSYKIVAAGEQDGVETNGVGNIGPAGFDYDAQFGGSGGSNSEATYLFATGTEAVEFVASLAWNVNVDEGSFRYYFTNPVTLYDLDLQLFDVSDGGNWVTVLESASTTENTENIRAFLKANTPYALRVTRSSGQSSFSWDYALAWRTRITGDTNGDGSVNVSDLMLLERAITAQVELDQQQRARADVHPVGGNGTLNVSDVLSLQKILTTP